MNPATIIRRVQADGITLVVSASGTIKATGDGAAVNRWLALIRERKHEIIEALKVGAGDTALLAELEAAANRLCAALGDNGERRAIMLEDCREFPPERWPWLIDYLNAEAAKCEAAVPGNDSADNAQERSPGLVEK